MTEEREAFLHWFHRSGFWNNAITEKAWMAALDWQAARTTPSADAVDAQRYRFIRATTKAIRDDDGAGRVEVTPEQFDKITDAAIAASAPKEPT